VLAVAGNGLTGSLPESWSSLSKLTLVELSFNTFTASIPASWAETMLNMRHFTVLNSSLTGQLPREISRWTNLGVLSLANNSLSGTLPKHIAMPRLQLLDLGYNNFNGPLSSYWAAASSIARIDLTSNAFTGTLPPQWSTFPQLIGLALGHNKLERELPQEWSALTRLYLLQLNDNSLTGKLPEEWHRMQGLNYLDLDNNYLTGRLPVAWSELRQIKKLSVAGNLLTGSLAPEISGMSALTTLNMSSNYLNGDVFVPGMFALQTLGLASNEFTGSLPSAWSAMTNLTRLDVSYNGFTSQLPIEWSALEQLQYLDLRGNAGLSGRVPPSWSAMSGLTWLGLPSDEFCGGVSSEMMEAATASGSCAPPSSSTAWRVPLWLIILVAVVATLLLVTAAITVRVFIHRATCSDPLCAHRHPGFLHSLDGHLFRGVRSSKCKWCMWDGQPDLQVPFAELSPLIEEEALIGYGGFSRVYKGRWRGRVVAVKVLNSCGKEAEIGGWLAAFQHEVDMCLRCNDCDRMVRLYGACYEPNKLCLINEYLEGGSLHERIHGKGQPAVSVMETLQIAKDIATGLMFMHPEVVHRDIKPDNILLEKGGRAKIIDLGLGRVDDNPLMTHINTDVSGTASYMSPEQCEGRVSTKTDIYALGVLMNECLAGKIPFEEYRTALAVQYAVTVHAKRPNMLSDCPVGIRNLITRCWEQDQNKRPGIREVIFMIDFLIEAEINGGAAAEPKKRPATDLMQGESRAFSAPPEIATANL